MLVIEREVQEDIVVLVGERKIIIKLIKSKSNKAWIGFDADSDIKIWRSEIYRKKINDVMAD